MDNLRVCGSIEDTLWGMEIHVLVTQICIFKVQCHVWAEWSQSVLPAIWIELQINLNCDWASSNLLSVSHAWCLYRFMRVIFSSNFTIVSCCLRWWMLVWTLATLRSKSASCCSNSLQSALKTSECLKSSYMNWNIELGIQGIVEYSHLGKILPSPQNAVQHWQVLRGSRY